VDRRSLITVAFERASPDDTCPSIEVVFQIQWPEEFNLLVTDTPVLIRLSTTRQDTREHIALTPEEEVSVYQEAATEAAKIIRSMG